jgi:hypothetical protein
MECLWVRITIIKLIFPIALEVNCADQHQAIINYQFSKCQNKHTG